MFGDNETVVSSNTIPHSTLGKRWNALSYHRVREAIAGGWLRFHHIPGTQNPADILTKPLPWASLRVYVEPLLLWKGDTDDSPAGSSNPEGSIVNPGPAIPRKSNRKRDSAKESGVQKVNNGSDGIGQHGMKVPSALAGNQYAVLFQYEDD